MNTKRSAADKFHPIIYVRGYAMTDGAMEDTVHTPYMGFNLGSTRVRQQHDRSFRHYIFESPLIRLMKEYGYQDSYAEGVNLAESAVEDEQGGRLSAKSVIIHRYYEAAEDHPLRQHGDIQRPSIEEAASRLSALIRRVQKLVCGSDQEQAKHFKVYLVAHSMGGLICRCMLQNEAADPHQSRQLVDKVFTFGTPHNGIEVMGFNVPQWLGWWDANNFNRSYMARYLKLDNKQGNQQGNEQGDAAAANSKKVNSLNGCFPAERFFCLVGTNPHDYGAARFVVKQASDGLVTMDNAYVDGSPRVYTYTSHSGPYGMVNSKVGYDNLVRFLFGDYRLTVRLVLTAMPLPPPLQRAYDAGSRVRGSYLFDCTLTPRGDDPTPLSDRRAEHHSAVFRSFDELFHPQRVGLKAPRHPVLASVFLDSSRIEVGRTMVLTASVDVESTGFHVDGASMLAKRAPKEHIFRSSLTLKATLDSNQWTLRYVPADTHWSDGRGRACEHDEQGVFIPLSNAKGFAAKLYLTLEPWH